MALLKALDASCRDEVEQRFRAYQLQRASLGKHKRELKQQARAELTRPGTLAAVFTLGVLVTPRTSSEFATDDDNARQRQPRRAPDTADSQSQEPADGDGTDGVDLAGIVGSVLSSVVVRMLTTWVSNALFAQSATTPASEADQEGVDTGN